MILTPNTEIEQLGRISEDQKKALTRLRISTVQDLLLHFPNRYGDTENALSIETLEEGTSATVYGQIEKLDTGKTWQGKVPKASARLRDETGTITITWFRQPYIARMMTEGSIVKVTGKITSHNKKLTFVNPKVEQATSIPTNAGNALFGGTTHTLYPVYPETRGITSNWIYHALQKIFSHEVHMQLTDPIPKEMLEKYNLPSLQTALIWVHTPKSEDDAYAARKRFAFQEVFLIQLKNQKERNKNAQKQSFKIAINKTRMKEFVQTFPFQLTKSQKDAIQDIVEDFASGKPMSRLLEGDVGSGKTAIAAATVFAVTDEHLQTAYMVPTEILAKQHFASFIEFFKDIPMAQQVKIGLITGSGCYKYPSKVNGEIATKISRAQLLKWIANGEIPIVIGTHSLIQKTVIFENLAYVIIDEQHRFGTVQRQKLARKDDMTPHFLSMTATPIPRTLALSIYGDLDLTIVDQMPMGRKPIITELVLPGEKNRNVVYEKLRELLREGRQAYVICPRINEPDPNKQTALNVASVKAETARLKEKVFPNWNVAMLHSKMKPDEKDKIMKQFEDNEIDVLVSTSVIEVGVNVPNATTIIIEGAERFGLSQLHQLRGRVLRSSHQAYAYLFSDTKTETSIERLKALQSAKNGFELSEFDLQFRGSGELYGKKQWGITDLGMEAIKNIKMVEFARKEAQQLLKKDPELDKHTSLQKFLEQKGEVHFE